MLYFWDVQLDADLEQDIYGWQQMSGSLSGQFPSEELVDPCEVGRQLDPSGALIREWVPELKNMPEGMWTHMPHAGTTGFHVQTPSLWSWDLYVQ